MKSLVLCLTLLCVASVAFGQQCNVPQQQQSVSAASTLQSLSGLNAIQQNQLLAQPRAVTSASAVATPSVAQLRAAAAPVFVQQSVPTAQATATAGVPAPVAVDPVILATSGGNVSTRSSARSGSGIHLPNFLRRGNTQTTRSVAISRTSSR